MALISEDGTGLSTAEAYNSVATFKAYCDARGLSYAGKTDTQIEQALRRASTRLDALIMGRFSGGYRITATQALLFPLSGLVDRGGYGIPYSPVPRQILAAEAELAVRELASPGSLTPDITTGKIKKRVRVEGAVEVEYAVGTGGVASQTPIVSIIDGILAPLIGAPASPYFGTAVRA